MNEFEYLKHDLKMLLVRMASLNEVQASDLKTVVADVVTELGRDIMMEYYPVPHDLPGARHLRVVH